MTEGYDEDFVAAKLVAGTAESTKVTLWWPKHAGTLCHYAIGGGQTDEASVQASREDVLQVGAEWENVVKVAARRRAYSRNSLGLMREHASLELLLIDASILADVDKIEWASVQLEKNADAQRARYARAVRGFPERKFSSLMRGHLGTLVELLRRGIDGQEIGKPFEEFTQNSVELGALMAEWF